MAIRVGTSGWSYPSWRPGFYPEGMQPPEFLSFYARHFDTVELNSTGYRLPSEDQFRRWADAVPDGFRFAVKLPLTRLDRVGAFLERVVALGDRLGPVRIVSEAARDEGLISYVEGSVPPDLELAWDLRHESWAGIDGIVRVNDPNATTVPLSPPARAAVHRRGPAHLRRRRGGSGLHLRPPRGRADRAGDRHAAAGAPDVAHVAPS